MTNSTRQVGGAETRKLVFRVPRLDLETLTVKPHEIEIVGPKPAPASDLEQVSRERDEAVRLLRLLASEFAQGHPDVLTARALLNTMDDRDGGESV